MEDTHTSRDQDLSTGHRSYRRRRAEAEPSCVSLKSDASMDNPRTNFRSELTTPAVLSSVHQKRAEAEPSCVSMKSDVSMDRPIYFKSGNTGPAVSSVHQKRAEAEPSCVSMKSDASMDIPITFRSENTQPAMSVEYEFPESGDETHKRHKRFTDKLQWIFQIKNYSEVIGEQMKRKAGAA